MTRGGRCEPGSPGAITASARHSIAPESRAGRAQETGEHTTGETPMASQQRDEPTQRRANPLRAGGDTRRGGAGTRWPYVALTVAVAAAVAATAATIRARSAPALAGAVLNPPVAAYEFRLPDQDGRTVSLADLRGKIVALTFLYTHCPDVCPFIADEFHAVHAELGAVAGRTAFVAVSVDPAGDTLESVRKFLASHRVLGEMTYLRGTSAQLRPVWAHYYVGSDAEAVNPDAVSAAPHAGAAVDHTAIVYLIDQTGKIVLFLPGNLDPRDLAADIRALVGR